MGRPNEITPELADYIRRYGVREHPALVRCREETHRELADRSPMQIAPEQGAFLALLVRILGASRTLEIGVFTGYSSLAVALALPPGARVTACDVSREYTDRARRYWAEAGVIDRVDLRLGPALETLDGLLADGEAGLYDFAFIDADKTSYDDYYERALVLVRAGGVIAIDNTLWDGAVVDPEDHTADTMAIRALNEKLHADDRIELALTTIGDGLTLCLVRDPG